MTREPPVREMKERRFARSRSSPPCAHDHGGAKDQHPRHRFPIVWYSSWIPRCTFGSRWGKRTTAGPREGQETMGIIRLSERPRLSGAFPVSGAGRTRRLHSLAALLTVVVFAAACGGEDSPEPTTDIAPTATAVSTVSGDVPISGGLPGASPAATPGGDGVLTLGDLADRIDAAWDDVDAYRAVFVSGPGDVSLPSPIAGASPVASPVIAGASGEITREIVVPDRQRQVVRRNGEVVSEAVAIGDQLYIRGELAQLVRSDIDADTWISLEPGSAAPSSRLGQTLSGLTAPIFSPTIALPDNLRPQEIRSLGTVDVGGRQCDSYGAADTTDTGERIDVTFAVGPDDLPCFIETRAGTIVSRVTYEAYNMELSISPPATAIAIASPEAGATPLAQD